MPLPKEALLASVKKISESCSGGEGYELQRLVLSWLAAEISMVLCVTMG